MKYEKPEVTVADFAAMERLATLRLDGALDSTSVFTPIEGVETRDPSN